MDSPRPRGETIGDFDFAAVLVPGGPAITGPLNTTDDAGVPADGGRTGGRGAAACGEGEEGGGSV